jgi:hypothetical protein
MARVGMGTVVVGATVVLVVVLPLEVVVASVSEEQAPASTTRTSRTDRRRYMVDLEECFFRSPSRDRAAP